MARLRKCLAGPRLVRRVCLGWVGSAPVAFPPLTVNIRRILRAAWAA